MPGVKKMRGDGREDAIALDDELFRVLPDDDADPDDDSASRRRAQRRRARAGRDIDGRAGDGRGVAEDLDDFDDPLRGIGGGRRRGGRSGLWLPLAALVGLALAGWVAWMVLAPVPEPTPATGEMLAAVEQPAPGERRDMPVVRADPDPYKTEPNEPGGLRVENTDKEVYARVRDSAQVDDGPAVEQLLPGPVRPVSPPTPEPAPEPAPAPTADTVADPASDPVDQGPPPVPEGPLQEGEAADGVPAGPTPESAAPGAEPDPAPQTTPQTTPQTAPEPESRPAPEAPPAAPPENVAAVAESGPQVQLAAFRRRALAQEHWETLRQAHPDLLGSVPHVIVFADLGDKGQFYRLRAGPLASADTAGALCRALEQRDVECLVVRE